MKKAHTLMFLIVEACLYAAFLWMDLSRRSPEAAKYMKYIALLFCLGFSCFHAVCRTCSPWIPFALLFTAAADYFLLLADSHYETGITIFIAVQGIYCLKLRREGAPLFLWARAGLPMIFWLALFLAGQGTSVNLLAGFYFPQLLVNAVSAWTLSGKKSGNAAGGEGRPVESFLFAMGLSLFVCCDICVGLNQVSYIFPDTAAFAVSVGMWLFYLPSQVLIVLSGMKKTTEETS